ncbi:hypothetical protein A6D87_02095 [Klebsiella quasipneumoniae]|nr:hypothetical protein A6D87_02095 [Klebsiella quasipneumoniae]
MPLAVARYNESDKLLLTCRNSGNRGAADYVLGRGKYIIIVFLLPEIEAHLGTNWRRTGIFDIYRPRRLTLAEVHGDGVHL